MRSVTIIEPSDRCNPSLRNRGDVKLRIVPTSTPSQLVEEEVVGLVVDAKGRGRVQHGRAKGRPSYSLLGEVGTNAPAVGIHDLLDGVVLLLVVDSDLGLISPASSSETSDWRDARRGKGGTIAPPLIVDMFADGVFVINVIDTNLWRVGCLGVPDDGSERCARFCLEQFHGL